MKKMGRTPITYYGGKQKLTATILEMMPPHTLYCEPFSGGAAVFFAKEPVKCEVLNDTNKELINFYRILANKQEDLLYEINSTLYSRSEFNDAWAIYNYPHLFTDVKRAWALWVLSMQGFSGQLSSTWGYDKQKSSSVCRMNNRREELQQAAQRLKEAQLECTDALRIIGSRDHKDAFFYCDPPYYNSDCGHYDGYTEEDYRMLLEALSKIEGKFLLSSYPSELLQEYAQKFGWKMVKKTMNIDVGTSSRKKIEVLTMNY